MNSGCLEQKPWETAFEDRSSDFEVAGALNQSGHSFAGNRVSGPDLMALETPGADSWRRVSYKGVAAGPVRPSDSGMACD